MKAINSYVAVFDFLGFKAARNKRGTDKLYSLYMKGLLPFIQHSAAMKSKIINEDGEEVCVPDPDDFSVDYRIFSDTIILLSKGDSYTDFLRIIGASHELLRCGFLGHKIPLRGAIGHGDLICDDQSICIGSAIEDAYIGETQQAWSGCALTEAFERHMEDKGYLERYKKNATIELEKEQDSKRREKIDNSLRHIVKYNIPEYKNSKTDTVKYKDRYGYALDWTLNMYEGAAEKSFIPSEDPHVIKIAENTKNFEVWAHSNNR